ncbi:MAG: hypothetical protein GY944_19365 [bacterium]|nr:hypothetical protein [bacterium]
MIPDPLHPFIVHFPIVLAAGLPFLAAAAFWAIRSERLPRRSWIVVLALQVLLLCSAWLAVETGERDEERVEQIVAEQPLEDHEEAAERLLAIVALGVPLSIAGLLAGPVGSINRGLVVLMALIALVSAGETGRLGGKLVYRHGAANAYAEIDVEAGNSSPRIVRTRDAERHHDDDDD